MKNFYAIYDELKTGDLIFFSGKGIISKIIQFFSGCDYSHVGMVLKLQVKNKIELVILESNGNSFIVDYHTGEFKSGVSIVNLTTKLHSYRGNFAIKQLSKSLTKDHILMLGSLIHNVKGLGYPKSLYGLLSSIFKLKPSDEVNSLFCSQLIVIILKKMKLIKSDIPPEWYTPCELTFINKLNDEYRYYDIEELTIFAEIDNIMIVL